MTLSFVPIINNFLNLKLTLNEVEHVLLRSEVKFCYFNKTQFLVLIEKSMRTLKHFFEGKSFFID